MGGRGRGMRREGMGGERGNEGSKGGRGKGRRNEWMRGGGEEEGRRGVVDRIGMEPGDVPALPSLRYPRLPFSGLWHPGMGGTQQARGGSPPRDTTPPPAQANNPGRVTPNGETNRAPPLWQTCALAAPTWPCAGASSSGAGQMPDFFPQRANYPRAWMPLQAPACLHCGTFHPLPSGHELEWLTSQAPSGLQGQGKGKGKGGKGQGKGKGKAHANGFGAAFVSGDEMVNRHLKTSHHMATEHS
jgi:hypothetical protein